MIQKPTNEQLKVLYPNISTEYLSDNLDRKLLLIEQEDEVISKVDVTLNNFREQIVGILCLPIGDKTKLIQTKVNDLEFQLANMEIDAIIQLHETSGYLYEWLLEKYFLSPTQEMGGEQTTNNSVSRKKLLKKDIQNLVSQTVSRGQNISTSISGALKSFMNDISRLTNSENVNISDVDNALSKVRTTVEQSTRSILQQSVFDAESNTQIYVSDGYQVVYYRVEVLDGSICMNCLQIDGSINEKPLGLMHRNCRGIDVVLLKDLETGKYYDTDHKGYGHKLKTKTFEQKFESLSARQKRQMLGKSNYELYSTGKLKPNDFLSNNRQITNAEANLKVQIKALRKEINTPQKATNIANYIEGMFNKELSQMTQSELLAYEKMLGIQKQLYEGVPTKAFSKSKPKQSYIDAIDAKYDELNRIKQTL